MQDHGVFNGDIKLDNTLVDAEGNPRIIDFGQAKFAQQCGDPTEEINVRGWFQGGSIPLTSPLSSTMVVRQVVTRRSTLFIISSLASQTHLHS